MNLSSLGNSAAELLAAFADALVEIDPNFPLTGNQYVGAGEIPWDKPGLYVYLAAETLGQPGAPVSTDVRGVNAISMSAGFYVMIIREVATFGYWNDSGVNPASDAILNANGTQAINDAGMLVAAAIKIKGAGTLVNIGAGFAIGQCTPVGPMGGMAAVRLQLDLSIENA